MHKNPNLPAPADEPVYWLLFGAGGMAVAIVLPAIIILMLAAGLSSPDINSGLLNFEQIKGALGNWFVSLIVFSVMTGVFFHAFHRMYHSLHELGVHVTKLHWFLFYGAAAGATFFTLAIQVAIYFKLW